MLLIIQRSILFFRFRYGDFGGWWCLHSSDLCLSWRFQFGLCKVRNVARHLACFRLRDSGEKSFSKKKCKKRAGAGERQPPPPPPPFPSRARLIFALLVLIRPHYTIREPGTGYSSLFSSFLSPIIWFNRHQTVFCLPMAWAQIVKSQLKQTATTIWVFPRSSDTT